jgi:hypothetical protein
MTIEVYEPDLRISTVLCGLCYGVCDAFIVCSGGNILVHLPVRIHSCIPPHVDSEISRFEIRDVYMCTRGYIE